MSELKLINGGGEGGTVFDQFPDPKSLDSEQRISIVVDIIEDYHDVVMESDVTSDRTLAADHEINRFFKWMGLTDEEMDQAISIVRTKMDTEWKKKNDLDKNLPLTIDSEE